MNNYFRERMEEIQFRTEQMAEKKTYELEIESLGKQLKAVESNYQHLEITCQLKMEKLAFEQVNLNVAKEAYAFAKDMLNKNQVSVTEERKKMDNLHWQVWNEQMELCDEMDKCLRENDSVDFLNEYPRVLKAEKCAFLAGGEFDEDIKSLVKEHPEIKQLTTEVTALEMEIMKTENSYLTDELHKVLNQIEKLTSNDDYNVNETQRLIEVLETSHRERMSLEATITEIENRRIGVFRSGEKLKMSKKESKDFFGVKNEPQYDNLDIDLMNDEEQFKNEIETSQDNELRVMKEWDKKLKAKKWYEEYARDIASSTNKKNDLKNICNPLTSQWEFSNIFDQRQTTEVIANNDCGSFAMREEKFFPKKDENLAGYFNRASFVGISEEKFIPKSGRIKRKNSGTKSRSSIKNTNISRSLTEMFKLNRNLKTEKENMDVKILSFETTETDRKFQPMMATPSTFIKPATETKPDNNLVQSDYNERPDTSSQIKIESKKTVKFTPKRPSNMGKKLKYRQTKLDDFDYFMLTDNKKV